MTWKSYSTRGALIGCCLVLRFLSIDGAVSAVATPQQETVSDYDGNLYKTAAIGKQVWMAENLRVTHYRDGSAIPNMTDGDTWSGSTSGAYCWYGNDAARYKATYGPLYNFHAVVDARNICPAGWHVPSDAEWGVLEKYLGGSDVAGGKMKVTLGAGWNLPNTGATNESGFTGIAGGGRGRRGEFGEVGNYGTWWSSTQQDEMYAWHRGLYTGSAGLSRNAGHKASGFSIRCLRD